MAAFARHLFICVNQRAAGDPRGCCADKGSLEVAEAFKQRLHQRGLKRIVRANKSGCLDQCSRGVTVVVYPEGIWYGGVTLADVDEIIERHVIGGQVVERLRLVPAELTGRAPPPGVLEPPAPDPRNSRPRQ